VFEVLGSVDGQVCALGKVLSQQSVGVLVGASLPRGGGVAEVDRDTGRDLELLVAGHLRALIPGQRPAQMLGQGADQRHEDVADGLGCVIPVW